jgi:hypothetical protein
MGRGRVDKKEEVHAEREGGGKGTESQREGKGGRGTCPLGQSDSRSVRG